MKHFVILTLSLVTMAFADGMRNGTDVLSAS